MKNYGLLERWNMKFRRTFTRVVVMHRHGPGRGDLATRVGKNRSFPNWACSVIYS